MDKKLIDIQAPIKPLHSIGGIRPGKEIQNYSKLFIESGYPFNSILKGIGSNRIVALDYINGLLRIEFDVFTGVITRVQAGKGYQGHLLAYEIGIGTLVSKLIEFFPDSWDSDDFNLWNINFPGIYFGFLENGLEFTKNRIEEYKNLSIIRIGMIAPDNQGNYDRYGPEWYECKNNLEKTWLKDFPNSV